MPQATSLTTLRPASPAREFFATHQRSHQDLHSRELTTLGTVNMSAHILTNPLVKVFRWVVGGGFSRLHVVR